LKCRYDGGILHKLIPALLLSLVALDAAPANLSPAGQRDLAPAGKIRAAINFGNPVLVTRDRSRGLLRGVAVDIARELGRQVGMPVQFVLYAKPGDLVAGAKAQEWDIAFVSVPAAQTGDIVFTVPYMDVEVTYLVGAHSRFQTVSDVDGPGVRIVVQDRNSTDLFLSTRLMHGILFRTADEAGALKMLKVGAADAFASSKHRLQALAESDSDYRVLEGRFAAIAHSLAVPAERNAALAYLNVFLEEIKASGFLKRAVDEAGVRGVVVLPVGVRAPSPN
jgi:polar amino acid transport system substrate-binding protein